MKFFGPPRPERVLLRRNTLYGQNSGNQWESTPSWRRSKSGRMKKFHLENAQKLRGIYFIDPEDKEFKETVKNARKKLETSVAPAMPCKILKNCGSGGSDKNKTKLACILEANESRRMRMGNSIPSNHEDHIAGKGENSLQQKTWYTNLFLCLKLWKFQQRKQRWTRNVKNWTKFGFPPPFPSRICSFHSRSSPRNKFHRHVWSWSWSRFRNGSKVGPIFVIPRIHPFTLDAT